MNVKICMCIFFTDKGLQIRATHIFLQIRTFTDKGPIIITDKAFLHIRASQTSSAHPLTAVACATQNMRAFGRRTV